MAGPAAGLVQENMITVQSTVRNIEKDRTGKGVVVPGEHRHDPPFLTTGRGPARAAWAALPPGACTARQGVRTPGGAGQA